MTCAGGATAENCGLPRAEICPFKAIQPAKQRERIETASIERASKCVTTGGRSGPPLRRVRQRNQNQSNPTSHPTRCAFKQHPSKELQNALPQANTAAPPTQSWSKQAKPKQPNQPSKAMRGGMWNGRASRRTQGSITIQENKTSAGIGTTVEHPPRERIETASIEKVSIS